MSSHLKFDAATLGGTGALTLALSLPAQSQLALGAGEGLMASLAQGETGVSVSASSTARTLVVSGTAAQLSALLAGTTSQIRYTGPGATATGTPIALQLQLVDSIGHASSTAVSLEAPTVSTATLSGATLTLPVSRVATPGARVPLMLGSEAFRAAGLAPISVEIEAPQAAVTVIGAVAGVVTLASGTVTVSVGDTFTREVDGTSVSIASTRLTGSAAALNELFSRADGVMVESAAGGSIAIRVVGDISSRGQVAVTASPAPDKVMSGPSLRVPAGYTLPSGGTILLPTQAVAGEGVLKLVVSTSAGALKWAASSALRAATTGEATLTAGTGATLTLVGSAQALNAFLTTRGALRFEGDADAVLSFALSTQPTDDKPALIARAESAITVLAVDLERTPTLGLRLPQGLALAATGSTSFVIEHDLVVADRAGAVTLTLTLPSAVTGGEAATLALLASPDGVTITRQPNGQIALSGTAAALNAYLKTANALSYTGPAGMLGFAVAQGDLRAEGSTLLKRATPGNTQLRNAPRLALPFNLVPAATSGALVLYATAIQPARWSNLAGTMAVEFSLTAGALKLGALPAGITAADGEGVALVAYGSASVLRLSGPAGALTAWLASVPAVGAAAPLTYVSDPDAGDLGLPAGALAQLSVIATQNDLEARATTLIGTVEDGLPDDLVEDAVVVVGDAVIDDAFVARALAARINPADPVVIAATGSITLSEAILALDNVQIVSAGDVSGVIRSAGPILNLSIRAAGSISLTSTGSQPITVGKLVAGRAASATPAPSPMLRAFSLMMATAEPVSDGQPGRIELRSSGPITLTDSIETFGGTLIIEAGGGTLTVGAPIEGGTVSLAARDGIVATEDGQVTATVLDLYTSAAAAAAGDVGSPDAPLVIDLVGAGAVLSGEVAGSLHLSEANGDLVVGRLSAVGSAVLATVQGSILGTDIGAAANLRAASVRFEANSGGIGRLVQIVEELPAEATAVVNVAEVEVTADEPVTDGGDATTTEDPAPTTVIRTIADAIRVRTAVLSVIADGAIVGDEDVPLGILIDLQQPGLATLEALTFTAEDSTEGLSVSVAARGDLRIAGEVSSAGAPVALSARGTVSQTVEGVIDTAGGDLTITATRGSIIQMTGRAGALASVSQTSSVILTGGGTVLLDAGDSVLISQIDASGETAAGSISLIARTGSIIDNGQRQGAKDLDLEPDLIGASLWLDAAESIGETVFAGGVLPKASASLLDLLVGGPRDQRQIDGLEVAVDRLAGRSGGSIYLLEEDSIELGRADAPERDGVTALDAIMVDIRSR
ncbi:MAG: beta strand repeat-containing protein, partial [Betaproteobacteria bacterium]